MVTASVPTPLFSAWMVVEPSVDVMSHDHCLPSATGFGDANTGGLGLNSLLSCPVNFRSWMYTPSVRYSRTSSWLPPCPELSVWAECCVVPDDASITFVDFELTGAVVGGVPPEREPDVSKT